MDTKQQAAQDEELEDLFPAPISVDVRVRVGTGTKGRKERLEVTPMPVERLGAFARIIKPLLAGHDEAKQLDLGSLVSTNSAELIDATAIGIDRDRRFVAALLPDDFLNVAKAVVLANTDFFLQNVAPLVSEVLATISILEMPGAGPTRLDS